VPVCCERGSKSCRWRDALVWAHSRVTPPRRNSSEGDNARDAINRREDWKAFSLSAVPSSSDYSEVPAITLALGIDELPEPLPDQSLDTSAGRLPSVEGQAK
jgi:hypothetical protein